MNNILTEENKHIALVAMKAEYNSLTLEEKKKYMDILTEWYMREKDLLRNKLN